MLEESVGGSEIPPSLLSSCSLQNQVPENVTSEVTLTACLKKGPELAFWNA